MDRSAQDSTLVRRVAAIDIGTVSTRLGLSAFSGTRIVESSRNTNITDLGEGVDATGRFSNEAIERVAEACCDFTERARAFGADRICTTLTSAARDASNAALLLGRLSDLGLEPQVISGETEASLTFYGVAHDFRDERIIVADSGGGSTEFAVGRYGVAERVVAPEHVRSIDVGCRRLTDRFFSSAPPRNEEIDCARVWAEEQFSEYWAGFDERPERLVVVGGTVTTLMALAQHLTVYDSSRVHLSRLASARVSALVDQLRALTTEQIAKLPGIQAKRAPVILGGAIIIAALMRTGGYSVLTVSENSLLAGVALTVAEVLSGESPALGWEPRLSR